MFPGPSFSSNQSEERWVSDSPGNSTIDLDTPPCVFQVPQSLRDTKPQAYTPQTVGLGPYHHLSPEDQQMESQKQAAVKEYLEISEFQTFIDFVNQLPLKLEPENEEKFQSSILSFYDGHLDIDSKTLVWIVAIDSIFLLQFLNEESKWEDQRLVADIMMLENQIPLTLLKQIREALRASFPVGADIELLNKFYRFCERKSPLKLDDWSQGVNAAFQKHMLHFLYNLIVNNYKEESREKDNQKPSARRLLNVGDLRGAISRVGEVAKVMVSNVIPGGGQARTQSHDKHRLANKIDVPSVSQLHQIAKIKFAITDGGIRNIWFDDTHDVLYLPEITLCESSEVVLRNLLAYEVALAKQGSILDLELAAYVDLMCGIIDADIDVKLLKEFNIIKGNLPDEEIVGIFNGIDKSTQRPDEKSEVEQIVQKFNKMLSN